MAAGHSLARCAAVTLLAVLPLLHGCTDGTPAPLLEVDVPHSAAFSAASVLQTGKYRDSGLQNATGRAGSATLAARAVLWSDGVVRLLVTTGDVEHPEAARGVLARVQLRIFGPDGRLQSTTNHNHPAPGGSRLFLLPGLPPGSRIEVQANVRDIDRNRTGVVTITETVKLASVLTATIAPVPSALVGVPVVVTATVSETGGSVGAFTSCILLVDGAPVDRIDGVWVDAGDEVSCAFTYEFDATGTYEVAVQLTPAAEEMGIVAPPPSSTTVVVSDGAVASGYEAVVLDRSVEESWTFSQSWWKPDGSNREYRHLNVDGARSQTVGLSGSLARDARFPIASVRLRLSSTAAEWQTATWSGLGDVVVEEGGRRCVGRLVPEQGGHFQLCSLDGVTRYGYTRFAGTVTYHSRGFWRTWNAFTGIEDGSWTWNETSETHAGGGQIRPLGTAVTLSLEIEDAVGPMGATVTVPVSAFDEGTVVVTDGCREESPYWLDGGILTTCERRTTRAWGARGEAGG